MSEKHSQNWVHCDFSEADIEQHSESISDMISTVLEEVTEGREKAGMVYSNVFYYSRMYILACL